MLNWFIKKIKNEKSKYDFRLATKNNNYSKVNFKKHDIFRILVSLSLHLTNGIFLAPYQNRLSFFKVNNSIFDFEIVNYSAKKVDSYMTISKNMKQILYFHNNKIYPINKLANEKVKVFSGLFLTKKLNNLDSFFKKNKKYYSQFKNNFIVTGYSKNNNIILDLVESKKEDLLIRYQIEKHNFSFKDGYFLVIANLDNQEFNIKKTVSISFDEYLTYIYDLMLPYKYDFNDYQPNQFPSVKYDNFDIQRNAFAIDPNGSKDRDDAIAAFYFNQNKIVNNIEDATHIKLIVHISDTLSYIKPDNDNYYYHFSKYKTNTDYLDHHNLPMMDRVLSEKILSLQGDKKEAITIQILYRISNNRKFLIDRFPERIEIQKSKNLNIVGTTYHDFANSFSKKEEEGFSNSNFLERLIIPCNKNIIRDFNHFIQQGHSQYKNKQERQIANNLKQLYIMMVNSLDHTGKDTLLKIPSGLTRSNNNIYLDFDPIDMWAHSLVEYTALETNIYFSYLLYLINSSNVKNIINQNKYVIKKSDLIKISQDLGNKNQDIMIHSKKLKSNKIGIFRNLYVNDKNETKLYLNLKSNQMLKKFKRKYKFNQNIIDNILSFYRFDNYDTSYFLKLMLSLRQMMLLKDSKTNLDISRKLISKDIKMKAEYDYQPVAHLDICTYLYTHSTSPMRRFVDINVHNLIFNLRSRDYIFKNLNLNYLNSGVDSGKNIFLLVNQQRFIDFIKINDNPVLNIKILDPKFKTLGFIDLVNFFNFNSLFNLKINKDNVVKSYLDEYNLPSFEKTKDKKKKKFNLFFHMLRKNKYSKDIHKYLEIIFKVKKVYNIC